MWLAKDGVLLFFQHNCTRSLYHWPRARSLSWIMQSNFNQWAIGIMGFTDESELAQSKHDPPTEPIITDPVRSLLWGKTHQTAKMKAVLRPVLRVSHSLAALIITWLRGAWYMWRSKATYRQAVSPTTYMPQSIDFTALYSTEACIATVSREQELFKSRMHYIGWSRCELACSGLFPDCC